MISAEGVAVDNSKLVAIQNWAAPRSITQLRGFLGLAGYYRHFVRDYAAIANSLTELLKNNAFHWSESAQQAFDSLKAVSEFFFF